MNHHRQKPAQRRRPNPAYRQAFERLDTALSENSLSYNLEKKAEACRILFGRESDESANRSPEKIPEQSNA